MTAEECWQVASHIVAQHETFGHNLDLRLLENCFNDYLQWRDGFSENDWCTLVDMRLQERVLPRSRDDRNAVKSEIALEIRGLNLPLQREIEMWREQTGHEQAAFYRALSRASNG
jgi:hypothetical protein